MEPILKINHLTKIYPGVVALDHFSDEFYPGQVHAIVGENGAGKSTLIKMVSGAVKPDDGEIIVNGQKMETGNPMISQENGIAVIYQDFSLVMPMTVSENIFLGREPKNGIILNRKEMNDLALKEFKALGLSIDPNEIVGNLSNSYMQLVEIVRAISKNAKILIMDEPTSTLSTSEVKLLFEVISNLKQKGVAIIYISHRLDEIFEMADRVTILRDGQKVTTELTSNLDHNKLIRLMVGRELTEEYPQRNATIGEEVFEIKNLYSDKLHNISFKVRKGEVLGLGGLVGSGRSETAMSILGYLPIDRGQVFIEGKEIKRISPSEIIKNGIGLICEDRKRLSLFQGSSVKFNFSILTIKEYCDWIVVNKKKELDAVNAYKEAINIKTSSLDEAVADLSGGNQQKVVISRWLASNMKVLIFDEPTQGIDDLKFIKLLMIWRQEEWQSL